MRIILLLVAGTALAAPVVQWGNLPLSFELNQGQAPADIRYLARGSSYTLYLAGGETLLAGQKQSALRTRFSGANLSARIQGEARQPSTSNYFVGNDPRRWQASVPNYDRVRYAAIYPGIDLLYYGKDGHLEYDWIVAPGADPARIRMVFEQADQVAIDKDGDLLIRTGESIYRHKRPVVYQQIAGRRVPIQGEWKLHGREGSFRIGAYDHSQELVIDPP